MKRYLIIFLALLTITGCRFRLAFNDASIPADAFTASVQYFVIDAPLAKPTFGQSLTEAMKDIIQSQSRLNLVSRDGDVQFSGRVTRYAVSPVAVQGGDASQTALNRLTVSVNVQFVNTKNMEQSYESTFTKYADFSSSQNLASVEEQLLTEITQLLVQDIFNKAFSQW